MLTKLLGDRRLKYDNYHAQRRIIKIKKISFESFKTILNYY